MYIYIDTDGDNIDDCNDNCFDEINPCQADNDNDSLGDICDPDDDNDGKYYIYLIVASNSVVSKVD